MKTVAIIAVIFGLTVIDARAQQTANFAPPVCYGPNQALQFGPNPNAAPDFAWYCAILNSVLPPVPSNLCAANYQPIWNGTKWGCIPQNIALSPPDPCVGANAVQFVNGDWQCTMLFPLAGLPQ